MGPFFFIYIVLTFSETSEHPMKAHEYRKLTKGFCNSSVLEMGGRKMEGRKKGGRNAWLPNQRHPNSKASSWEFPGGPVAKTPCSQCRGPMFDHWSGS